MERLLRNCRLGCKRTPNKRNYQNGDFHEQYTGWDGVHGSTMNLDVFKRISDLKEVTVSDTIGEHDGEFYSGKDQSQTTYNTGFYRIDENYIVTNCPPLIEIK